MHKKGHYLRFLILVFISTLLHSCSVGIIHLSVLQPAQITLPSSVQSIAIHDYTGPVMPVGTFDSINNYELNPQLDYNEIKKSYLEGLYDVVSVSPRFSKVTIADTGHHFNFPVADIPWDSIRYLCEKDTVDALIVLQNNLSTDFLETEYEFGVYCYIHYEVVNKTSWVIYVPQEQFMVDSLDFIDTLKWERVNENCDYIYLELPGGYDLLSRFCYQTGTEVGYRISPFWEDDISRYIFIGNNRFLRQAANLVSEGQWYEAAQIWNQLSESRSKRLASKASFNIALAYERDDVLDQARLWITHADSIFSNNYTALYKQTIEERLETRKVLDRQMTGN